MTDIGMEKTNCEKTNCEKANCEKINCIEKIAVLSNINMNFVIRMLQKDLQVYEAEGYGNELGILMNPESSYHEFAPKLTFFIMDLMELLEHDLEMGAATEKITNWFAQLGLAMEMQKDKSGIFYVSDAYLWGQETAACHDAFRKAKLEGIWMEVLEKFCREHSNVRMLPYAQMLQKMGEDNAFSLKMWYLGKILLTNPAQKVLCDRILEKVRLETKIPKKVLVLDLDNTLWGGLAGENDHTPIVLSEDHSGLAYKNLQRVIGQMQKQGVLLAIVSKNNEEDVQEILEEHPHMVLRPECFAVQKINWEPKHENVKAIAEELNLGLDSFVFFDDNPTERALIKETLPQVEVPDFPDKPEELAQAMVDIYKKYFEKTAVTGEDLNKTAQYASAVQRNALQQSAGSFEDYLKQLQITMERVDAESRMERLVQLVNKTNQFNLTTKRYTQGEMQEVLDNAQKQVYLYQVADRFGDNGIVAAVIVDVSEETAVIEEFVMSCRVMGKNIEYAILDMVETDLQKEGIDKLRGIYLPTVKNKPIAELYPKLGYTPVQKQPDGGAIYELELASRPKRNYAVSIKKDSV